MKDKTQLLQQLEEMGLKHRTKACKSPTGDNAYCTELALKNGSFDPMLIPIIGETEVQSLENAINFEIENKYWVIVP
jgi:hypothetical protein